MNVSFRFALSWAALLLALALPAGAAPSIALQPLGDVPSEELDAVAARIGEAYPGSQVVRLPKHDLPASAWYAPRSRYRAEKLLMTLGVWKPAGVHKIIGVTSKDISTTKGPYPDWGIFGYGNIAGPACVVSDFRLKKNTDASGLRRRLSWVVAHELGHTFGLEHCPSRGCLMEDAAGQVATVDRSSGVFCPVCRKRLAQAGVQVAGN
jgi:archaemetzincin